MKKFFTKFFAFALLSAIALLSTGCGGATLLSFSNAFNGDTPPAVGYVETLEYTVKNVDNKSEYPMLGKDEVSDKAIESFNYQGTFKTTFEVRSGFPDFESDIKDLEEVKSQGIHYYYKTELNLHADFVFKTGEEKNKSFDNSVVTEAYFLPNGLSFAPIATTYKASMHLVQISGEAWALSQIETNYSSVYNSSKYVTNKLAQSGEQKLEESKEYGYTFRSAIDNNVLLFALRSFATEADKTSSVSVIAPAYGEAKTLNVKQTEAKTISIPIKYNGNDITAEIPIKNVSFSVNDQYAAGANQYLIIQTGESKDKALTNKALLIKYAEPLITLGSMSSLGALEYTLTSVTINN